MLCTVSFPNFINYGNAFLSKVVVTQVMIDRFFCVKTMYKQNIEYT